MRAPTLYYLHPSVSMTKGNGEPQIGNYLDMPDNSAAGDVSLPSDPPSTASSYPPFRGYARPPAAAGFR
jgi:hypothetical protein